MSKSAGNGGRRSGDQRPVQTLASPGAWAAPETVPGRLGSQPAVSLPCRNNWELSPLIGENVLSTPSAATLKLPGSPKLLRADTKALPPGLIKAISPAGVRCRAVNPMVPTTPAASSASAPLNRIALT